MNGGASWRSMTSKTRRPPLRMKRRRSFPSQIGKKPMFEALKSPRFRVQSPFLQNLRSRFGRAGLWLVLVLVPLFFLRACVLTYVPPDQIGVRQISFGSGKGLQKEPVGSG